MTSKPPTGLGTSGRALWRDVLDGFELSKPERAMLRQACRAADELDALADVLERDGYTVLGSTGQTIVHPAVSASNATRSCLLSVLVKLDVLDDSSDAEKAAKRSTANTARTAQARAVRWSGSTVA